MRHLILVICFLLSMSAAATNSTVNANVFCFPAELGNSPGNCMASIGRFWQQFGCDGVNSVFTRREFPLVQHVTGLQTALASNGLTEAKCDYTEDGAYCAFKGNGQPLKPQCGPVGSEASTLSAVVLLPLSVLWLLSH